MCADDPLGFFRNERATGSSKEKKKKPKKYDFVDEPHSPKSTSQSHRMSCFDDPLVLTKMNFDAFNFDASHSFSTLTRTVSKMFSTGVDAVVGRSTCQNTNYNSENVDDLERKLNQNCSSNASNCRRNVLQFVPREGGDLKQLVDTWLPLVKPRVLTFSNLTSSIENSL